MRVFTLILVATFFTFSCKKEEKIRTAPEAYEYLEIIAGTWAQQPDEKAVEIWHKTENNIVGQGLYVPEQGDTSYTEVYFLEMIGDSLRLEVQPITEDGTSPSIQYFLTKAEGNSFTFENPSHNFPKQIKYVFRKPFLFGRKEFQVFLEGDINGYGQQADLLYKKK